jgi:(2Fe-2S) ferredoxin
VLTAFQAKPLPDVDVVGSQCLGQCGNGPMVLVMPDQVWYSRIHPDEVAAIVQRHLWQGQRVEALLYPKYHSA